VPRWAAEFSEEMLTRAGLGGLLGLAALASALDFWLAGHRFLALTLTAAEAAIALPWIWLLFHLERGEQRLDPAERRRRRRLRFVNLATVLLVAATLAAKAFVHFSPRIDPERVVPAYRQYVIAYLLLTGLGLVGRGSRAGRFLATVIDHPARLMTLAFGCAALLGAFVLTLPVSLRDVANASFLDALFNSTGAVCGAMSVGDLSVTYAPFGQFVIFVLMQMGGLGVMSLSAFFAIAARRRFRAKSSAVMAEMIDADSLHEMRRTVISIVIFTVTIELLGAIALWIAFSFNPAVGLGPESADPAAGAGSVLWSALFHSVSAFCTAGFSLSHGNMTAFAGDLPVAAIVGVVALFGGMGFPVMRELAARVRTRLRGERPPRLSLNARVSLSVGTVVTVVGAIGFLVLEWGRSLAEAPVGTKVIASGFQSVSSRSAGFNAVDFAACGAPALLLVAVIMFIGASPGSTGGGIKTTTLAVIFATIRAELRGHFQTRLFDRRVTISNRRKAIAVVTASATVVLVSFFALLVTESAEPMRLLFESVSAFACCGLSAGVTAGLSVTGKLVIIVTMLAGRIGPLTLGLLAASPGRKARYTLPEERIQIG
jgi:trk system potassium uptake protein TrkH